MRKIWFSFLSVRMRCRWVVKAYIGKGLNQCYLFRILLSIPYFPAGWHWDLANRSIPSDPPPPSILSDRCSSISCCRELVIVPSRRWRLGAAVGPWVPEDDSALGTASPAQQSPVWCVPAQWCPGQQIIKVGNREALTYNWIGYFC